MALAPNHETANLLHVAIDVASSELREPIDRIEFVAGQLLVSAGNKRLVLNYQRSYACDDNGIPFAGGGSYVVEKAGLVGEALGDEAKPWSWWRRLIGRR